MKSLYSISGVVMHGNQKGRELGFPTANFALQIDIPEGIYAAEVLVEEKRHHAATFVGAARTFGRTAVNVESYLFDFKDDLYGKKITVTLYKKIRDNEKFNSEEALITQMKKDVEAIKKFFSFSKQ
jgi:riboflavin kinase / FMN adenylyltransferase